MGSDEKKPYFSHNDVFDAYRDTNVKKSTDGKTVAYGPIPVDVRSVGGTAYISVVENTDGLNLDSKKVYFKKSGGEASDSYSLGGAIANTMFNDAKLRYEKENKKFEVASQASVAIADSKGKVERVFFGYVDKKGDLVLKHSLNVTKPQEGKEITERKVEELDEPIRIKLERNGDLRSLKSSDVDKLKEASKSLVMAEGRLQGAIVKATDANHQPVYSKNSEDAAPSATPMDAALLARNTGGRGGSDA